MMNIMRRFKDLGIEGRMARWYDRNTRSRRMDEMKKYAQEVSGHLEDGASVLEVAPGPGYLSIELAKVGSYRISAIDISRDFVEIARRNAGEAGVEINFQEGNVANIPFPDASFDFVVCTAAFKNFRDPLGALNQMYRVLKPEGTVLIVDMNRNVSSKTINEFTESIGVKGAEALFMKSTFKFFLRNGAYTQDDFSRLISKTLFKNCDIKDDGMVLYVYLRKKVAREYAEASKTISSLSTPS
jgi:ubiquinone/menaquinone biosynthesis C-methylase UbiE